VRTLTKLVAGASILAMTAVLAGPASAAAPPPINVANDHANCNSIVGGIKLSPALTGAGGPGSESIAVKAALGGCSDADNANVFLASGGASGTLTGNSSNCTSLFGSNPVSGTLTTKWKTATGAPKITPAVTTANISGTDAGASFGVGGNPFPIPLPWGDGTALYGAFILNGGVGTVVSIADAFSGGDGGAASNVIATTSQDVIGLGSLCAPGGKGIKAVTLGIGGVSFG